MGLCKMHKMCLGVSLLHPSPRRGLEYFRLHVFWSAHGELTIEYNLRECKVEYFKTNGYLFKVPYKHMSVCHAGQQEHNALSAISTNVVGGGGHCTTCETLGSAPR